MEAGGVLGLHAYDADVGPQQLDVDRHAGDQPAAADRNEDRVRIPLHLPQQFHGHRALAGDHIRVVEGMDEHHALRIREPHGLIISLVVGIAVQVDARPQRADRLDLDARRGLRHHDQGLHAPVARGQRHALGVIARRGRDHAARHLGLRQQGDLVAGPAQLEGKHRLQILALEQHPVPEPGREPGRGIERGLARHVVDVRVEDHLEIAFRHDAAR